MNEPALLIVNPRARGVTPALASAVVRRLSVDLDLEVVETQDRLHAVELARDAVASGVSAVITFSGDGTVNEAANAVAGTAIPLGVLPGGATNVLCRRLGFPSDLLAATDELLLRFGQHRTRRMRTGRISGRVFVIACGAGLDAAAMRRAEAIQCAKDRLGSTWLLACVLRTLFQDHLLGRAPRFTVTCGEEGPFDGVLAIVPHMDPATYYRGLGLRLTPFADPTCSADLVAFSGFPTAQVPALVRSLFRSGEHVSYPNVCYRHDVKRVILASERPFPVQVDGDYAGLMTRAEIEVEGQDLEFIA